MRKWLLLLLLAPALVVAQEKASEDEDAEPVLPSPEYRSVAFIDPLDSADCDPIAARFGACVEKVEFAPTSDLWELPLPPNAQQLADEALQARQRRRGAILRNLSHLHAWLWEDLAFRWNRSGTASSRPCGPEGSRRFRPPPSRGSPVIRGTATPCPCPHRRSGSGTWPGPSARRREPSAIPRASSVVSGPRRPKASARPAAPP